MFNVDGKEFVFLVLIALVVLGPEKLPDLFRRLGKAYAEFRRLSEGFQEEFRKAVEEPTTQFKETGNLIRESADLRMPSDGDEATSDETDGDDTTSETEVDEPASNRSASNRSASDSTDTTSEQTASDEDVSNPTNSNGTESNGTGRHGVNGDVVDVGDFCGESDGVRETVIEATSDVSSGGGEQ